MRGLATRSFAIIFGAISIDVIAASNNGAYDHVISQSNFGRSKSTFEICPLKWIRKSPLPTIDDIHLIRSERQIAIDGHMSGFRPLAYDVQLRVPDFEHFMASVTILMKSVEPTRTLIINFDIDVLRVDTNNIRLHLLKADSNESMSLHDVSKNVEREICFNETMKFIEEDSLLIMDLQETLPAERLFLLEIRNYRGRAYGYPEEVPYWDMRTLPPRSRGLRRTDPELPNVALYTLFQMRLARTVFPSFDHPIFKANFSICIAHKKSTVVLSNTISESRKENWFGYVDCFETTPKIPIYAFTFSVLENFTQVKDDQGSISIEIYYPADESANDFDWQKNYTSQVLSFMKQNFELELGVSRLAFLNLRPCVMWGIENYGLISLDAEIMQGNEEMGRTTLVHEIVHQWLGDDATISYWDEICLQEGLTAYLDGQISEALNFSSTLEENVADKVNNMLDNHPYILSAPIRKFNVTQDIADHCFGYPFIVFYMMKEAYGEDLWTIFLKRLFTEHHFGNANFTQWIRMLDNIIPITMDTTMPAGQFLYQWFTSDGYPVSYVRVKDGRVNIIQRATYGQEDWRYFNGIKQFISDASVFRPILYKVIAAHDRDWVENSILVDSKNYSFKSTLDMPKWVVLDPAGVTLTRIFYEPEIYMNIIHCFKYEPSCAITAKHFKRIFEDFCFAFSHEGIFPTEDEKFSLNTTMWNTLLDTLHDLSSEKIVSFTGKCGCCFTPKSQQHGSCKGAWNSYCRQYELMPLIGRDYVL